MGDILSPIFFIYILSVMVGLLIFIDLNDGFHAKYNDRKRKNLYFGCFLILLIFYPARIVSNRLPALSCLSILTVNESFFYQNGKYLRKVCDRVDF